MERLDDMELGDICDSGYHSLQRAGSGLKVFPGLLKKIIVNKAWERRIDKNDRVIELKSLRDLITLPPWEGWHEDPKKIEAIIKDDPEALTLWRSEMYGELSWHGVNQHSDLGGSAAMSSERNNNYWQARIARDCPEELEAIKRGEKTIIQVRKERDWVSNSKRITLTGDAEYDNKRLADAFGQKYVESIAIKSAVSAYNRLSHSEKMEFLEKIGFTGKFLDSVIGGN